MRLLGKLTVDESPVLQCTQFFFLSRDISAAVLTAIPLGAATTGIFVSGKVD
jgi:hypothetical protein